MATMKLPQIIGDYEFLEQLGKGAYAIVYKARHTKTNMIYAIKKMKNLQKDDQELAENEINLMKKINHKNIVRFEGQFFDKKNKKYIVLQYCGKGDLQKFKKKVGKIPEYYCKSFVLGMIEALSQLHRREIAHRDLKLANVLITDDYKLKLADFGFSKQCDNNLMKTFCGSPLAMAPQILNRQKYDSKCDVWSLGVLTYIMLYDKPPFTPSKDYGYGIPGITNVVLKTNHKFDEKIKISDQGKKFIDDCLKKDPNNRSTMDQLREHEWFEGLKLFQISKITGGYISISMNDETESIQKSKIMLFEVFEEHIRKIVLDTNLSQKNIRMVINTLHNSYSQNTQIMGYFFALVGQKLNSISEKQITYILNNSTHKIPLLKIKKYIRHAECIQSLILDEINLYKLPELPNVNLQKYICTFVVGQAEKLLQQDNASIDHLSQKLEMLKIMCHLLINEFEIFKIQVEWGKCSDLQHMQKSVDKYLTDLKTENVINIINEQNKGQQDLQAIWLIEHQLINKESNTLPLQLAKLVLYVLSITSNFS